MSEPVIEEPCQEIDLYWALGVYNNTVSMAEFLRAVEKKYTNANVRDCKLIWQAFDVCSLFE